MDLREVLDLPWGFFPTSGRLNADVPQLLGVTAERGLRGGRGLRPIEEKSTNHGAEVKTGAKCKSAPFLTGRGAGGGGGAAHLALPAWREKEAL